MYTSRRGKKRKLIDGQRIINNSLKRKLERLTSEEMLKLPSNQRNANSNNEIPIYTIKFT